VANNSKQARQPRQNVTKASERCTDKTTATGDARTNHRLYNIYAYSDRLTVCEHCGIQLVRVSLVLQYIFEHRFSSTCRVHSTAGRNISACVWVNHGGL